MTKRFLHLWMVLAATMFMSACHIDDDESVTPSPNPNDSSEFKAFYAPLGGLVPFPNDLFIDPTTGKVAIPVTDDTDFGDPKVAMNSLNGFSTIGPTTARFSSGIDPTTLVGNQTVFFVNVTNPLAPVVLLEGVDYTLGVSSADSAVLEIKPVTALSPDSQYVVIVTTGVSSSNGDAAAKDDQFQTIVDAIDNGETLDDVGLELVKTLVVEPLLAVSAALAIVNDDIAVIWSYTTQSLGSSLNAVASNATAQASAIGFAGITTAAVNPALFGIADVYVGTIDVPYFLDPNNPLTGFWERASGNPAQLVLPVTQATLSIPVILTVPNTGCGVAPFPVAIFQHGITRDRTDMFAVAEAFANPAGFCGATIAIDMPLHGITDNTNLFFQAGNERHFDLDADGDGVVDSSGANYINLPSLLTSRDNLRQSSADIISLINTIPTIDFDGGGADLDGSRIFFSGLSLGAMNGMNALAFDSTPFAATFAAPGGAIGDLLVDSASFSQPIVDGLAAVGIVQGTQLFNDFIRDAQTVIDDGDPLNTIATTTGNVSSHLIEVVGDLVIPNTATEKLITVGGFRVFTAANPGFNPIGPGAGGAVRFIAGEHGSILDPTVSLAATTEMQTQMATLAATAGTLLLITNTTVIEP